MMDAKERRIRQRLKDDLPHYARKCLKIRSKSGAIVPLEFNKAQMFLHGRLQSQLERQGMVRALTLKGRQQGISTYVGARYYHGVTHSRGNRVFILTHEQEATENLFDIVNRYHEHCPQIVRPHAGAANAKELFFDKLDSGYKVGTAGTKGVGRSQTVQRFHGSEVAFWPHAETHAAGVLQAVPNEIGTEILLESTANGMGNLFHTRWQQAEADLSDYEAIFIPWFWQDEYRMPADSLDMSTEDAEYMEAYGLDAEQMAWRQSKIRELDDADLFRQEYPANSSEAFQMTGQDSYITPASVMRARKNKVEGVGALVIGVDPARYGDDRFSIAWRRGRQIEKIESRNGLDTVAGANWVKQVMDEDDPDGVFVDVGGIGGGTIDILHDWGGIYRRRVVSINFGGSPQEVVERLSDGTERPGPRNRRAEMWKRSKEWLADPAGVDVPDRDSIQTDACAPRFGYDMQQRLVLESKEKMRARGVRSPDEWDAVVLTFAEPPPARGKSATKPTPLAQGSWMA